MSDDEVSLRLTRAVEIASAARAILMKSRRFPDESFLPSAEKGGWVHVGIEPMLLALSMELALKAWYVFDYNVESYQKTHDLAKLFDDLKSASRERLDAEFQKTVRPHHPEFVFIDQGVRQFLYGHKDAFKDWRYLHENEKVLGFDQSAFEATLEMVLREFRKRYREVAVRSVFSSI
ncbi:hypothetical protein [Oceaniradius stylonematis]|uniref:hypothetical protein n=1 Tax=Oceaniradius stylonematis TaxID=2184161 RepID=UPI00273DBDF1|nr:hypothetical protein [Oceaniradius stylonematis]